MQILSTQVRNWADPADMFIDEVSSSGSAASWAGHRLASCTSRMVMAKAIQRVITNDNTNGTDQGAGRFFRVPFADRGKWIPYLMLVVVMVASRSVWAQPAVETSPRVGSPAISPWANSFDSSSSTMPAEHTMAVAELSPRILISPAAVLPKTTSHAKTWWILSGVVLTASSLVDLGTSLGHKEANPALSGSSGQISVGRGVSLKLGLSGVTLLVQSLITRHRPDLLGPSAVVNVIEAGAFGAVSLHNVNTPH
jgi:hypothetical protein